MKSRPNPFLRHSAALCAVVALVTHTQAATPITIVNPSFETGNIGGWGGGPDTGALNYLPQLATNGSWVGFEGNWSGGTYMFQDVGSVPLSGAYTFSIDLGVYWTNTGTNNGTITVGLEKTGVLVSQTVVPVNTLNSSSAQTWSVTLNNNGSITAGNTLRIYVDKGAQTTGGGDYLITLDSASLQAIDRNVNWTNGASNMTWSSTDDNWSVANGWDYATDNAVFGATGVGTVNLANETIGVHNITFNTAGYTIAQNTLALNNSTITTNADATISSALAGSTGLIKAGNSTLTLSGTNTYTGATNVNAGKLVIDGSTATGSAVTIANGAILGGSGTVGGATTINGTHTPGNSPGVQSFSGALTYGSTSIFEWDLASSATGDRGTQYDGVNVGGTLTGSTGAAFKVVLGSGAFNDAFWNSNQSWTDIFKANVDGSGSPLDIASVFSAIQWYEGTTNMTSLTGTEGYFTLSGSSLTWTAVPEPTSALAGLLLTAGLLRRRRR